LIYLYYQIDNNVIFIQYVFLVLFRVEKRRGYSRRRAEKAGADVDFINDRNMRFNRKIERFYGRYTTEIKQNLERGTAV
jgi:pre-mRNA-splicing factor SYF2